MTGYFAFLKKELLESIRSYRLILLLAVFLLLGILNPLTAKIMPDLLQQLIPDSLSIETGEPTALDSWAQFYKNVPQMGLAVTLILFSGILSREYANGTLVLLVTRGLSRISIILAKFTMALLLWTAAFSLCFTISWAYTAYYWENGVLQNKVFAGFCLWILGLTLIAGLILGAALWKSAYGALLFAGGFLALLFFLRLFPTIRRYDPLALASDNLQLLTGESSPSDLTPALLVSVGLLLLFLLGSLLVFRKRIL